MLEVMREEIEWGGRTLSVETGKIARQADGAVVARYGETVVLATVVADKGSSEERDFFPLTVNYQEKTYAAGKIPGGFFKREARPSEKEILVSRLIDRPIRPMFEKSFNSDTQIIATVLSHDMENDPDIVAMVAVSAALEISGLPFLGPIAAARVGYDGESFLLNPTLDQMPDSKLDLVVAGTSDAVLMVESEAGELSAETMLEAVMFGQEGFRPVVEMIRALGKKCAKEQFHTPKPADEALASKVSSMAEEGLRRAYEITVKQDRQQALSQARQDVIAQLCETPDEADAANETAVRDLLSSLEKRIVRGAILDQGHRIDGRDMKTVRPIVAEAGVLPRTHGSALFTRGETQALVVTTLGTGEDEQFVDALEGTYKENFLLHYNFPPYSVGETGRVGFTGRREIGHGKLAWRALRAVLPTKESFPYTLRLVSEITESNGSSSMATVCGSSLALMDAGVPIARPVAGIAMGLIKEGDKFAVLSDILGDEDHLGDMDFKVAGTDQGITSLQMDIKITGITKEIMEQALGQAREGCLHILGEMTKALDQARPEIGEYAPRIEVIKIPQEKIREVIGTGGKVVREIVETTGAKIDISDDGTIKVASGNAQSINDALDRIRAITSDPEVGLIYDGTVVKLMNFGAFVNFKGSFGNRDGLVHISQIVPRHVEKVEDVLKRGDNVKVKLLEIDDRGKIRLSMKVVNQETGEEIAPQQKSR
ncbi:MAG: polyribonucleotide nucleotidyltransferase [Hyphomicrobiales bacterium]|nr:polyribonucleotide nucleotidyltransferase [Hyphomicrobiales bacterium]MCY4032489.1 polyribonucleotide nucleotidyltransferase [Hyphomicrobiales bacterium]